MKPGALFVLAIVGAFLAGYLYRGRSSPDAKIIAASGDSLKRVALSFDSSLVRRHPGDSAAVAEPLSHERSRQTHAVSLGDTVAALQRQTDDALAAARDSGAVLSRVSAALDTERAATQRQAGAFAAALQQQQAAFAAVASQLAFYRDTALVKVQGELSRAQQLLDAALKVKRGIRCGPGGTLGGGYGAHGPDAGGFIGLSCVI